MPPTVSRRRRRPRHAIFQNARRRRFLCRQRPGYSDRFLTTAFNLHFTKPMRVGERGPRGRWISGKRGVFVAEARIVDARRGMRSRHRHLMRSHIALSGLDGYRRRPDDGTSSGASRGGRPRPSGRSRRRVGTILKRGDADRGALILVVERRGSIRRSRADVGPGRYYRWQQVGPPAGADFSTALADWSQKRVRFDEDLWLLNWTSRTRNVSSLKQRLKVDRGEPIRIGLQHQCGGHPHIACRPNSDATQSGNHPGERCSDAHANRPVTPK